MGASRALRSGSIQPYKDERRVRLLQGAVGAKVLLKKEAGVCGIKKWLMGCSTGLMMASPPGVGVITK